MCAWYVWRIGDDEVRMKNQIGGIYLYTGLEYFKRKRCGTCKESLYRNGKKEGH